MSSPTGGSPPRRDQSLSYVFVTGLGWTAGSFGGMRLIAFAQTIILARLLSPADFGAFAMASLSVSLAQVFSGLGLAQAVIQSRLDDRPTLDTAFCINLVRGVLLFAILLLAAPLVERFYATPGVSTWTRTLALTVLFESATNPGMVLYLKNLDYRRAALYGQIPILVSTLSAIAFAISLRNTWALVLSQVMASIFQVPISYWAHPYRPRLRIDRAALRHLIEYGRFVLGSAPLFYLSAHIDEMAIGRRFGSRSMGAYQLAYNTSALPAAYLGELVSGVLFPVFARLQATPGALRQVFLKTVRHILSICLPASVFLFVFATDYVHLIYGHRWNEAIPILQAFFLYGSIRPIGSVSLQIFRAIGQTRALMRIAVLNLLVVSLAVFVGLSHGPIWIALLISTLAVPVIVYAFELVASALDLRVSEILRACAPAVAASVVAMAVALVARRWLADAGFAPMRLAAGLAVVAAVYVPALLVMDRDWAGELAELLRTRWPARSNGRAPGNDPGSGMPIRWLRSMKGRLASPVGRVLGRFLRLEGHQAEIHIVRASERVEIGSKVEFIVKVRNVGARRWPCRGANAVNVSYHWHRPETTQVDFVREGLRSALPADLRPGEEAIVRCRVAAPRGAGDFILEFDLVRKHVGWFADAGSATARTGCRVVGKVWQGYDDYLTEWDKADLTRDYWSIVGQDSKDEFESTGRLKRDCLIEVGLTPHSKVLDVGCGTGQLAEALLDYLGPHGDYYGTDIAAKAIAFCQERYRRPNFHFLKSELTQVPIEGRRFDAIALFSVFTHLYPDEIAALLEDLKRLLDGSGWILADVFISQNVDKHAGDRAMVMINQAHLEAKFATIGLRAELLDSRYWSEDCQRATYRFTHSR